MSDRYRRSVRISGVVVERGSTVVPKISVSLSACSANMTDVLVSAEN